MTFRRTRKMRRGGSKEADKCEKEFCEAHVKTGIKVAQAMAEGLITVFSNMSKLQPNKKNEMKDAIKKMRSKKATDDLKKKLTQKCRETYCNIGCKGTIFEAQKKLAKKTKPIIEGFCDEACRKSKLFGKKLDILNDNFYEKLTNIEGLKKRGAISGCTEHVAHEKK
jgi:hypothetical protein